MERQPSEGDMATNACRSNSLVADFTGYRLEPSARHRAVTRTEGVPPRKGRASTQKPWQRVRGWSGSRARLRYARLRHQAAVEDVDYRAARGLDRSLFQSMIGGRWIDQAQNLIIEGPAGVGKSWLACALGHKACRDNRSVLYQRIPGCSAISRLPAATADILG